MPHDCNGERLKEGDEVLIRGKIKTIALGEEYCNLSVETVEPMYPSTQGTVLTLNTRQVRKAPPPDPPAAAGPAAGPASA